MGGFKILKTGELIFIPVPLCLTFLDLNFETGFLTTLGVRIQVFDWGIREGMKKSQQWADRASRKKAIALLP